MPNDKKVNGCELCGDFPVILIAKCHPMAPLRIELIDQETVVMYCYVPECNREVGRFKLAKPPVH